MSPKGREGRIMAYFNLSRLQLLRQVGIAPPVVTWMPRRNERPDVSYYEPWTERGFPS